jgi:phenylacetate-coenzyme A ligase PaaK-like adenylate-forming protein
MNSNPKNHTPTTTAMRRTPVDDLVARRLGIKHPLQRRQLEQARMLSLRRTLRYAREMSPLYRKRLADLDITFIRTMADLERIPLLTGKDIAEHGNQLLCLSQSRVARVISLQTSGSTGPPKRFSFTADDLTATLDFFLHGMHSLIKHDDRVLVILPFELPDSVGDLLIRALLSDGIHAVGIWPPQSVPDIAATIRRQRLTAAVGLPQHLLALSEEVGRGHLQSMLLCSDYASPALRTRIEAACGCETFLHYGATESGLGGAVECRSHAGCHIRESELLIEIIGTDSNRSVPEGENGEVVITTLGRQAMPLIRYRTGDQASITASPCACGGVTTRLCTIRGRLNGHHLPDGSLLHGQDLDDRLFQIPGLLDYRALLDTAGTDRLTIDFVSAPDTNEAERSIRRMLLQVPAIRDNLVKGNFTLGEARQVGSFAAIHTLKRTILDQRT